MMGGSHIVDLRTGEARAPSDEPLDLNAGAPDAPPGPEPEPEYYYDEPERLLRRPLVWPAVAGLACLAWIGAAIWFALPDLKMSTPFGLVEFVGAVLMPIALVALAWLLAMRSSAAEARRFGDVSRALREEAASLEHRVAALTGSLTANRVALAEQTDLLMAMGDAAAERLAAISNGMAHEMGAVEAQSRKLTEAAAGAQSNLGVLLTTLPRAHAETHDLGNTLAEIGLTASERAAALDAQLIALGERGRDSDAIAGGAAQRLAAHLQRMEVTSETAGARLESVTAAMSDAVDALLGRTANAVDEARKGISAQGEAILAMLSANQAALDQATRSTIDSLAERIAAVEAMVDRLGGRLVEQHAVGDHLVERLSAGFGDVETRLETLHSSGIERTQTLAASISALGSSADAMAESLRTGDSLAQTAIGTTDQLLTALDAAAREIDETLPEALARLDTKIGESRKVIAASKPELLALVTAAESTHDAIEAIAGVVQQQRQTLDTLSASLLATLDQGRTRADALGQTMDATIGRTEEFANAAAPRLIEALMRVRDTAATAAERARETLTSVIPDAAREIEAASHAAMERAVGASAERQVRAIAEAAELAVEAAQRASERLTRQMLSIAEATGEVERRLDEARAERQTSQEENFARRSALLIEAMNSAAIDITKSFSAEVSDSAWGAYLKGDRGVFTRRAVRLLEPSDAREIARLYDSDGSFRDNVNRYIHDFEAMLRGVLAQREGAPLSVTLLSSDMGKLYVALAQAIERLRA